VIDPDSPSAPAARLLARGAAWLTLLGLLTGLYVAAAQAGKIPVDPHTALASHLAALLGAFLLLGVAVTLPLLRFGAVGQRRLAWAFIGGNFANWLVTAVKAALHVSGVELTGDLANNVVFFVLTFTVVLPTLGGAVGWIYGLGSPRAPSSSAAPARGA
jgi:hydroxylaminobenzene mutase